MKRKIVIVVNVLAILFFLYVAFIAAKADTEGPFIIATIAAGIHGLLIIDMV